MLHNLNLTSLRLHICIIVIIKKQAQRINTVHKEADGGSLKQEVSLFKHLRRNNAAALS